MDFAQSVPTRRARSRCCGRQEVQRGLGHLGPLQHHQVGEDEDRHGAGDAGGHTAQHARRRRGQAGGHLADAVLVLLDVLQGVRPLEQRADRSSAGLGVVDEPRQLVGERRALAGEGDGKGRDEATEHEEDEQEDGQRRQRPPAPGQPPLEPVDDGVERHGEERRHDQPDQGPPDLHQQEEGEDGREDQTDAGGDGAHGHAFTAVLGCDGHVRGLPHGAQPKQGRRGKVGASPASIRRLPRLPAPGSAPGPWLHGSRRRPTRPTSCRILGESRLRMTPFADQQARSEPGRRRTGTREMAL